MSVSRLSTPGAGNYTICTSATRPSSPVEGAAIYETDTDRYLIYTTSTTGWVQPWNMPWGIVFQSAGGDVTSSSTTVLAFTNSGTFTAVANRNYKTTLVAGYICSVLGDIFAADVREGGIAGAATYMPANRMTCPIATGQQPLTLVSSLWTVTAGVKTPIACSVRISGTGTIRWQFGAVNTILLIEDVGPANAPA